MTDEFDPYQAWLEIAPHEQPPNHYRLLGLELYEDNLATIEAAVDQRMEHVRTFQLGQHMQESQDILSQLAAAKICLCTAERKTSYDEKLQLQGIEGTGLGVGEANNGDHNEDDGGFGFSLTRSGDDQSRGEKPAATKGGLLRNKIVIQIVMVAGGGVTALVIALVFGILKNGDGSGTATDPPTTSTSGNPISTPGVEEGDNGSPKIDSDLPGIGDGKVPEEASGGDEEDPFADPGEEDNPFADSEDESNPFADPEDEGDSVNAGVDRGDPEPERNPFGEDEEDLFGNEENPFEPVDEPKKASDKKDEVVPAEEVVDNPFEPIEETEPKKQAEPAAPEKKGAPDTEEPPPADEREEEENPFSE